MSTTLAPHSLNFLQIETELAALLEFREHALAEGALPDDLSAIDAQIQDYHVREVEKGDAIAHVLRAYRWMRDQAKAEKDRQHAREKHFERELERLEQFTLYALKAVGRPKVETPTNTLSSRKCPASLLVTDPAAVPIQFKQVTVTMSAGEWRNFCDILPEEYLLQHLLPFVIKEEYHINNAALKAALQKGQTIPGAELVTDKVTLVVS